MRNNLQNSMTCMDLMAIVSPTNQPMALKDNEIAQTDLELSNMVKTIEDIAKRSIRNRKLREEYTQNVKKMSSELHEQLEAEPERAREIALAAISLRNSFMASTRSKLGEAELEFSQRLKKDGLTLDQLIEKELTRNFQSRDFSELSESEQLTFYKNVVQSSGRTSSNVDSLVKWCGRAGRFVLIFTLLAVNYTNPSDSDQFINSLLESLGGTIGWALGYSSKVLQPKRLAPEEKFGIFECRRKHLYKRNNRRVSLRFMNGIIYCYRLDKRGAPKKLYFSRFLDNNVQINQERDESGEWITIGITEKKLNTFWLRPIDGTQTEWLLHLKRQQSWYEESCQQL